MRSIYSIIIAALLVGCATTPDPIDRLVTSLSSSHGLWTNGIYQPIGLPATASASDVVSKVLQRQFTNYTILKIRQVQIPFGAGYSELYTAALVRTDSSEKIVLIRYEAGGWWNRIYDTKTSA